MFRIITVFALTVACVGGLGVARLEAGGGGGAVYCRAASGGGTLPEVALSGSCFGPAVLRVESGTQVTWVNRDPMPHNVTSMVDGIATKALGQAESWSLTFGDPGVFPYYCSLHPGMIGVVVVGTAVDTDASAAGSIVTETSTPSVTPEASERREHALTPGTLVVSALVVGLIAAGGGTVVGRRHRSDT
jgi:plastocyanin